MQKSLPNHIAIIMDGNGRWAENVGKKRNQGHEQGAITAYEIVKHAFKRNISHLTLFAFSTENWQRPQEEVNFLMNLLVTQIEKKAAKLNDQKIRIKILGDISKFPQNIQERIKFCLNLTKNNDRMTVSIALNYGARQEILNATQEICRKAVNSEIEISEINENLFASHLFTKGLPDPDLLIRTSGEQRVSNFLLWQIAYCELLFIPKFWPEFTNEDLDIAISEFQKRVRKYGKI